MRHRVYGKHLGRDKNQRTALFKGLIRSLILEESITTSETKAKAVRGLLDRLIVKGKDGSNASRNVVTSFLAQKEVIRKLTEEIAPRYKNRHSGFTRLVRMGTRQGDGTMMVKMSLVEGEPARATEDKKAKPEKAETDTEKPAVKAQLKKKTEVKESAVKKKEEKK